jgi:hypothetical protein
MNFLVDYFLMLPTSALDEIKCVDLLNSLNPLELVKSLTDFLVLVQCHCSPVFNKDLPNVFHKLCSLLIDLRSKGHSMGHLLNSVILLTCCLDLRGGKSMSTTVLSSGCDRLFESIFTSGTRNIYLLGEQLLQSKSLVT